MLHTNQRCYFNATTARDKPAYLLCTSSISGNHAQFTQVVGLLEVWHLPWVFSDS